MCQSGFSSSHRHVINTQARWLKVTSRGSAQSDRQRRTVGWPNLGPLWPSDGQTSPSEKRIVLFNAYPKHWGNGDVSSVASSVRCICDTAIPRGEIEVFRGGSRRRSRKALPLAAARAAASARGTLAAGLTQSPAQASGHGCGGISGENGGIEALRNSHAAMLQAASQAAESEDEELRHKAQVALANSVVELDSAIAALAKLRARARVQERRD